MLHGAAGRGGPCAEDAVHVVVVAADLPGVAVLGEALPGLVVLPLEALDADAALLGGALEAELVEAACHVPVDMTIAEISVQGRLHVRLPPDGQQGSGLHV